MKELAKVAALGGVVLAGAGMENSAEAAPAKKAKVETSAEKTPESKYTRTKIRIDKGTATSADFGEWIEDLESDVERADLYVEGALVRLHEFEKRHGLGLSGETHAKAFYFRGNTEAAREELIGIKYYLDKAYYAEGGMDNPEGVAIKSKANSIRIDAARYNNVLFERAGFSDKQVKNMSDRGFTISDPAWGLGAPDELRDNLEFATAKEMGAERIDIGTANREYALDAYFPSDVPGRSSHISIEAGDPDPGVSLEKRLGALESVKDVISGYTRADIRIGLLVDRMHTYDVGEASVMPRGSDVLFSISSANNLIEVFSTEDGNVDRRVGRYEWATTGTTYEIQNIHVSGKKMVVDFINQGAIVSADLDYVLNAFESGDSFSAYDARGNEQTIDAKDFRATAYSNSFKVDSGYDADQLMRTWGVSIKNDTICVGEEQIGVIDDMSTVKVSEKRGRLRIKAIENDGSDASWEIREGRDGKLHLEEEDGD